MHTVGVGLSTSISLIWILIYPLQRFLFYIIIELIKLAVKTNHHGEENKNYNNQIYVVPRIDSKASYMLEIGFTMEWYPYPQPPVYFLSWNRVSLDLEGCPQTLVA